MGKFIILSAENIIMESAYDKKFNLRMPQAVFKRVEELGSIYERSVNEQMVFMLKTWEDPSSIEARLERLENTVFPSEDETPVKKISIPEIQGRKTATSI